MKHFIKWLELFNHLTEEKVLRNPKMADAGR